MTRLITFMKTTAQLFSTNHVTWMFRFLKERKNHHPRFTQIKINKNISGKLLIVFYPYFLAYMFWLKIRKLFFLTKGLGLELF